MVQFFAEMLGWASELDDLIQKHGNEERKQVSHAHILTGTKLLVTMNPRKLHKKVTIRFTVFFRIDSAFGPSEILSSQKYHPCGKPHIKYI